MKLKAMTKSLISEIEKGGIVIAPRRAGKTIAALMALRKHPSFIYSTCSPMSFLEARSRVRSMGFPADCVKRVIGPIRDKSKLKKFAEGSIILDEFFWYPNAVEIACTPQFHAAVTSPSRRICVTDGKRWMSVTELRRK